MSLIKIIRYEQRNGDTYRIIDYFRSGQKMKAPIFAGLRIHIEEEKLSNTISDNKIICIYCGSPTDYNHCNLGIWSNEIKTWKTWHYCYYCQECGKETIVERNDKHWDYDKLEKELVEK